MVSRLLKSLRSATDGATAVEYGLLAGLISIGLLGGLGAFSGGLQATFDTITAAIEAARQ
ncbi:Flp family type IVb pilin [Shinella sp. CPCC 101442]|uniref:Flp family type IVb pilin n=1 Tax=Shinella sp. CPCC 101442 TaxID=2932265 RepID=UPI002152C83C|nr:Flp family type IVb pilin [Shinella sp. CPCC 101442]MCR6501753.1 Flp family type IVb pilin [Shinella sp. CPCC 101442]